MENTSSDGEDIHQIDRAYVKHELIGSFFGSIFIGLIIYAIGWLIILIARDENTNLNETRLWSVIFWIILGVFVLVNSITWIFAVLYVDYFSYEFTEKFIIIRYGVLTKTKTTIPYSRIQNVAVYQNIRDRLLKIYKVKIETAGYSAAATSAQKGVVRPEGYIPGIRNPNEIEQRIYRLVHKYTQNIPKSVSSNVFSDSNIVFDEFIAYFLSKMREKDQIKTKVRELREKQGLSIPQLADRIGVSESTIQYLESGEYVPSLTLAMKLASIFNVPIEDLFKLAEP